MDPILVLESDAGSRELSRDDLEQIASPDAKTASSRYGEGAGVWVRDVVERAGSPQGVTHVTFHAADGYAASVPLDQALRDGIVVVPPADAGKVGVRLVVREGETACLNVKAVERVELTAGPGKHTVDPKPHRNPPVPGWDR